ncbi:LPS translocon maturation chaperone LptM [Allopontixanthobacter sp.]|uniref:LPS translocon maturation chaperone LptM n=1 Tax=Allopontixanthobacter sp. TaxID=2906452 RepID=UPI002ABC43CF|nr:lipoprotein [Allopontixanthobacter sp.]MDZ4307818.1 lipoprotein [Allopontixanthobacter sp.]
MNRRILALAAACVLAGCGQKADLKPLPGQTLPVAPLGSDVQPDSEALLELDTQAAPERNVELRRRSESREDDPFDLPPE